MRYGIFSLIFFLSACTADTVDVPAEPVEVAPVSEETTAPETAPEAEINEPVEEADVIEPATEPEVVEPEQADPPSE